MPKLEEEVDTGTMQYKNLLAQVNKILRQQVEKNRQQTYKNIVSEDNEGLQKQLNQKQYVIEDMKVIQKAQGELIRNLRTDLHELKKDRISMDSRRRCMCSRLNFKTTRRIRNNL